MKIKVKPAILAVVIASVSVLGVHSFMPNKKKLAAAMLSRPSTINKYAPILRLIMKDRGKCSGAVLTAQYAVTAAHCILDEETGKVNKSEIRAYGVSAGIIPTPEHFVVARPVAVSGQLDFALIAGDFSEFLNLPSNPSQPELIHGMEEPHAICGFPMGRKELYCVPFIPLDIHDFGVRGSSIGLIQPGMSGGAVINVMRGTIDAIVVAVSGNQTMVSPIFNIFSAFEIEMQ